MSAQRPPVWACTGPLPTLSNLNVSGDASQALTHVSERGGPWDSAALDPSFHPALQSTQPMTLIYLKDPTLGWLPYLLVAESALLRRAGASNGLGVYALKRFRGPREAGANNGDQLGYYGGAPARFCVVRDSAGDTPRKHTLSGTRRACEDVLRRWRYLGRYSGLASAFSGTERSLRGSR